MTDVYVRRGWKLSSQLIRGEPNKHLSTLRCMVRWKNYVHIVQKEYIICFPWFLPFHSSKFVNRDSRFIPVYLLRLFKNINFNYLLVSWQLPPPNFLFMRPHLPQKLICLETVNIVNIEQDYMSLKYPRISDICTSPIWWNFDILSKFNITFVLVRPAVLHTPKYNGNSRNSINVLLNIKLTRLDTFGTWKSIQSFYFRVQFKIRISIEVSWNRGLHTWSFHVNQWRTEGGDVGAFPIRKISVSWQNHASCSSVD